MKRYLIHFILLSSLMNYRFFKYLVSYDKKFLKTKQYFDEFITSRTSAIESVIKKIYFILKKILIDKI